jgi:hypothetical protein
LFAFTFSQSLPTAPHQERQKGIQFAKQERVEISTRRKMVDTGGSSWHSSNRGVSVYIGIYLALFILVLVLSVSGETVSSNMQASPTDYDLLRDDVL